MPRPATTPGMRHANIGVAVGTLPALVHAAITAHLNYGPNDVRTLRAWEAVEVHGATIHRQARLLAGKSKGG